MRRVTKKALPIYAYSFFMIMPIHALFPLLPMIRDEINASYSQISIFLATLGIVRLLFAYPSGLLTDRFNQKYLLLFSGALCVGGLLLMSYAQSFTQLIVSRVLIGLSSIICNITILALIAHLAGSQRKGVMISMNNVVHNAGGIVSPALAGFVATWYSWRVSFWVVAGLILFSMAMIAAFFKVENIPKQPKAKLNKPDQNTKPFKNARFLISRLLPIFAAAFFVFFYRAYLRHTILPFFGKDVFHISVDKLGIYFSLTALIAMISLTVLGYLSDRLGRKIIFLPAIFLSAIAALFLLLPESLNPLLLCCVFIGLSAIINSMPNILISDLVHPDIFGRVLGLNRMFADSGYFLGTLSAGIMLDQFGFRIPVYWIAGYAGVMLVFVGLTIPATATDLKQLKADSRSIG